MSGAPDLWGPPDGERTFYRTRMKNGRFHIYANPALPGRKQSDPVRRDHPLLLRWMTEGDMRDTSDLPILHDYTSDPCPRCGAVGEELHHWAPKEYFGRHEAEEWPQEEICTECHKVWHERMNAWAEAIDLLAEWEEDPVLRKPATKLTAAQIVRAEKVAETLATIGRSGNGRVSNGAKYLAWRLTRLVAKSQNCR